MDGDEIPGRTLRTTFFGTAGIAAGPAFGSAYGLIFVMMLTPIMFLVKKYTAFT